MTSTMVVGALLRERANEIPDDLFLWCADDQLTFAQTNDRSERVAAGLAELGVRKGDRVAIISSNRIEMLEVFFACAKLGAIQVPLNIFLKGDFLRYQLDDSRAETLIVDEAGYQAAAGILSDLPVLKRIIAFDHTEGAIPYATLHHTEAAVPDVEIEPSDVLSILYTSGTTGMPKGCMLPNGYYLTGATMASEMCEYIADDVLFTALPLFHAWAQGMVMGALVHKLPAVVDPIFSVGRLLERSIETGATVFAGVGAMGMAMLGVPPSEKDRAHKLRVALMIPFSEQQQHEFMKRFGATVLSQLYGQTECGAIAYSVLSGPRNLNSVGSPAYYLDVRLVDDDDMKVPVGALGEIVVRPKKPNTIFKGYWRKPEETLKAWRNLWHHTGDYGRANEDGSITFVDRKKDALRRRGENISSVELEMAIIAHPKIAEAAVHGIPSAMTEDDIKACIVLVAGEEISPEELFFFFKDALPYFAIPRYVELLPELPRNATMRVMKHLLRDRGVSAETWDFDALGITVAPEERR
ncbi:MAG: AMP-binding protein [Actinomycetota bacterium]|nr:AMP-binding protein [Actinomycetota bacterium]